MEQDDTSMNYPKPKNNSQLFPFILPGRASTSWESKLHQPAFIKSPQRRNGKESIRGDRKSSNNTVSNSKDGSFLKLMNFLNFLDSSWRGYITGLHFGGKMQAIVVFIEKYQS